MKTEIIKEDGWVIMIKGNQLECELIVLKKP